jgi:hypothetical protein
MQNLVELTAEILARILNIFGVPCAPLTPDHREGLDEPRLAQRAEIHRLESGVAYQRENGLFADGVFAAHPYARLPNPR